MTEKFWFERLHAKSVARSAVQVFEAAGHSTHSRMGLTLLAIVRYCEANKIPYQLQANPGVGYFIEKLNVCQICGQILSQEEKPETEDCGGHCLGCMAKAGDPDAIAAMRQILRKK